METKALGFTIIEVMMFLAISSLLLLGILALSGTFINGTRFTDSVQGLKSFLQRQYEETTSGVNPRGQLACTASNVSIGTSSPGTSNCLLLGKVVVFRAGSPTVDTYNVVGSETTAISASDTVESALRSYHPATVAATRQTYSIPWGAQFKAGKRADSTPVNAVAMLRSPISSQVGVYHFSTIAAAGSSITLDSIITTATTNSVANYCVDGQDGFTGQYKAAITFGAGQGSSLISTDFDISSGVSPC